MSYQRGRVTWCWPKMPPLHAQAATSSRGSGGRRRFFAAPAPYFAKPARGDASEMNAEPLDIIDRTIQADDFDLAAISRAGGSQARLAADRTEAELSRALAR